MNNERIFYAVVTFAILCVAALMAQCSHRVGQCQESAIKAGMSAEDISRACKP